MRFEYALLAHGTKEVIQWRKDFGIDLRKPRIVSGMRANKFIGCGAVEELFIKIFEIPNKRQFRKSPNPYHNAKAIKNVEIIVYPDEYLIRIEYSLKNNDSHGWNFDISSDKEEYFYDYLLRVEKIIKQKTKVKK